MKKALIRTLYGERDNPKHNFGNSRNRIDKDILNIKKNGETDFVTYAFGKNNYEFLSSLFSNVVKVSDDVWPTGGPGYFINKIIAWKYAMQDYDEIVYLDWDCVQTKPLPSNFWNEFSKKREFQSPLYKCKRRTSCWRPSVDRYDNKRGVSGCFIYMREKDIPDKILKFTEDPVIQGFVGSYSDETYCNRYVDSLMGGWKGMKEYFRLFEPPWCMVLHPSFTDDKANFCFRHPVKG